MFKFLVMINDHQVALLAATDNPCSHPLQMCRSALLSRYNAALQPDVCQVSVQSQRIGNILMTNWVGPKDEPAC